MEAKTPRVDPRVLRTRQLLKDAFIELLQEMDVEKISVNRIAERATINRVTFYLHYKDIPDMLDKLADDMVAEIKQIINAPTGKLQEGETENWRTLVSLLQHIADHAKFYKVILASKGTPIFKERLLKMLTELISERIDQVWNEAEVGIQKDIAVWYGASSLIGTIVGWLHKDMPYTPRYLAKQFFMMRAYSNPNL
ncbi:TetR/AcrR family transcriptional regulator C-terminal domain-containing protein [Paenibacillus ferrarius]|uniref:TetR/AcrR family transcriptional regulator n=1 Tax=Paenibacillus ferrarius TaxID=1469647 RepID=UPI003D2942EA